jgi:hypothetical protein
MRYKDSRKCKDYHNSQTLTFQPLFPSYNPVKYMLRWELIERQKKYLMNKCVHTMNSKKKHSKIAEHKIQTDWALDSSVEGGSEPWLQISIGSNWCNPCFKGVNFSPSSLSNHDSMFRSLFQANLPSLIVLARK